MSRTAYGLIWEEWRRTRKLFLMVLFVLAGIAFFMSRPDRFDHGTSETVYRFLSGASLAAFIVYLPLSQSSRDNIQAGIPSRRYLLPVRTLSLVCWPLLFRLMSVLALASAGRLFALCFFESTEPHLAFICQMVALTAAVHMLAWSARLTGRLITAAGFFLLLYPGITWTLRYFDNPRLPSPIHELLFPAAAILVALGLTTLSLKILRSGGWPQWRRAKAPAVTSAAVDQASGIERRPFRSAFLAQVWYEWRALGKKMTIILCCVSCPFPVLLAFLSPHGTPEKDVAELGWMLLMVMGLPAGLWVFGKQAASTRRNSGFFVRTRPVDDALLGWARLGASAVTILASFAIVTVVVGVSYLVFVEWGLGLSLGGEEATTPPDSAPTLYLIVLALLVGAWIAYTRGAFVVVTFMTLGAVYELMAKMAPSTAARWWEWADSIPLGLRLALVVCLLLLCRSFAQGLRRGVLSRRTVLVLAAVWVLGTTIASRILLPTIPDFAQNFRGDDMLLAHWGCAALTLLALTPFAMSALRVHRQRHR